MNVKEFVTACEQNWKPYTDEQRDWMMRDAAPYVEYLDELFEVLRKSCRFQPRGWDIENAIEEMGASTPPPSKVKNLTEFALTSCKLCRGCGLLTVFRAQDGFRWGEVLGVYPYVGESHRQDFSYACREDRVVEVLYRCNCGAGKEMPSGYPMYRGQLVRENIEDMPTNPDFAASVLIEEIPF